MLRRIPVVLAALVGLALGSAGALAQELVNQGRPGVQGAWPVTDPSVVTAINNLAGNLTSQVASTQLAVLSYTGRNVTRQSATAPTPGTITFSDGGIAVQVQCDTAVRLAVPGVADGGNDELLQAGDLWRRVMPTGDPTVSFLPVTGTSVCLGWDLQ